MISAALLVSNSATALVNSAPLNTRVAAASAPAVEMKAGEETWNSWKAAGLAVCRGHVILCRPVRVRLRCRWLVL